LVKTILIILQPLIEDPRWIKNDSLIEGNC
jgi:hypothetical protein